VSAPVEGLLLVDKIPGPTSHAVVLRAREMLGAERAGHTGTLDPGATGLLMLLFGRATRLARFLPAEPKAYTGAIHFGIRTTTDDLDGEPIATFDGPAPDPEAVLRVAAAHVGCLQQTPPTVSARKVGGKRLYRLARRGRPAIAPPSEVTVTRLDLTPTDDPFVWLFEVEVSAGTYVRAIARDLGETLGCGGALARLRRVGIGPFQVDSAVPLAGGELAARLRAGLIPLDQIPLHLPESRLSGADAKLFRHGVVIASLEADLEPGNRAVFDPEGALLGVGVCQDRELKPFVVLPPVGSGARPAD
jgi:tRNA pseudouridine55 synthase